MKKIFLFISLSAIAGWHVHAQTTGLTIVKGANDREKKRPVVLFAVKEGERIQYASTVLDKEGNYAFALPNCQEGFYYLTDTVKADFTRIYLKPNDQLTINIGDKGQATVVSGSAENKTLNAWQELSIPVSAPTRLADTATCKSYFPALEKMLPQADAFKKKVATPNAKFNQLMRNTVDFDMQRWALRFLFIPHSEHPMPAQYPPYYATIQANIQLTNAQILQQGDAVDYISLYTTFRMVDEMRKMSEVKQPALSALQRTQKVLNYIPNDTLKGLYLANTFRSYRTYENLTEVVEPNKKYLTTPSLEEKYFNALRAVNTFRKGTPAYNFNYPDTDGKMISLASLKGKVVVVDMWATWCGPCKAEIPHLKQLEEEMHSNPSVAFVSISVDEEKDQQKWKDFVKTQSLSGIQLYAKGWSDMAKFYSVNAIPRFMVFDQQGKIVSVDAPRPSTPALKAMIESCLSSAAR